ncbi:MAG: hypothetical protein AAF604_02890 [Acidobacteriota bacterium]
MPNEKKSDAGRPSKSYLQDCVELLEQSLAGLERRSRVEDPFSADLAAAVGPTLDALGSVRQSYVTALRREIEEMTAEGRGALQEKLESTGSRDLLKAAVAATQVPTGADAGPAVSIRMENGARRIPWLELVKEIVGVLLEFLPVGDLLKGVISELLKIIDKIFGGLPHEDLGRPATALG